MASQQHTPGRSNVRQTERGAKYLAASAATDLLTTAVAFGTGLLIARFLGPHDRGVYTLVTTAGMLLAYAVGMGVFESLLARSQTPANTHAHLAVSLGGVGGAIMLGCALITNEIAFAQYALAPILWGILQVSLARSALTQNWSWIYLRATPNALQIAITLTLWATDRLTVLSALSAMLAGYIVALFLDRLLNGPHVGTKEPWAATIRAGAKQHILSIPRMANYRGPILVLGILGTPADVGFFAVASAVGSIVPTLTWSVTQNLLVLIARGSSRAQATQRALTRVGYASSIATAVICLWAGAPILTLLYGSAYSHTWPALVIVLAAQGMWLHSGLIQVQFRAIGQTGTVAAIEVAGIVAMVTVMYTTIGTGFMSAAFGTGASIVLTLTLCMAASRTTKE